jgi:sec-independent protein translocase protein TatA
MGSFSIWHWLILLVIATLIFGGNGKIASILGEVGQGIRAFRHGVKSPMEADDVKKLPEKKTEET